MLENFGDVPFYPGRVPAHTVAAMTALAADVRQRFAELPLGINVLRNDGQSALAIAAAVGAHFIRVNILCGARVADQGLLQGIAHDLLRDRTILSAQHVKIFADVDVKHSAALAAPTATSLESEVEDTLHRGLADALVVSGSGTGKATDPAHVQRVKRAAGAAAAPIFIGSGIDEHTLPLHLPHADGFIVGSAFKQDNNPGNPIDPRRVALITALLDR
jgi:membrane complex biogenesis BtpA family protein